MKIHSYIVAEQVDTSDKFSHFETLGQAVHYALKSKYPIVLMAVDENNEVIKEYKLLPAGQVLDTPSASH